MTYEQFCALEIVQDTIDPEKEIKRLKEALRTQNQAVVFYKQEKERLEKLIGHAVRMLAELRCPPGVMGQCELYKSCNSEKCEACFREYEDHWEDHPDEDWGPGDG